jgi:glycosyltransferase involved in cell wall biosynthesis
MGGAAARLHGLARWLAHLEHQVTVITGFPNYPSGVVPESYRGKLRTVERIDGVDVLRTWVYASSNRSSLRRLANYFSFVGSATIGALTSGRSYDVVVASSPPLFLALAALALARLLHIPFVFDIRDIWPDVAVEAGEFAPNAPITRLGQRLARFLCHQADYITPVTHNKRKKLLHAGVPDSKMTVVTNGVDLDYVAAATPQHKRAELGLEGKFVVLYAGLIGIAQGVEIAVDAADHLRSHQDVHFLIVGDGVRRNELIRRVERLHLANVTLLARQPREAIPALMATADTCLVPLVSSELEDAVPSKLLEAWSYGRPVILAAGGEAAALVTECRGGVVVPPGDADRLAEAILSLKNDRREMAMYAQNGRQYVRERFDRRMLADQMEQVLRNVVDYHNDYVLQKS